MQFLTNAIVTTLVVFMLLLPAFIVLRVFWGSSRSDIHADNIYSYLVWGIPLSILIYCGYYEAKIYKIFDRKHSFPTYAIWNLFADSSNKVDSSGNDVKRIANYTVVGYTDSIYETSLLSRRISKPVFDTVRVINGNPQDTAGLASIYSYVISKGINNTRYGTSKSRKFIKAVTYTYPVNTSPTEYQMPNPPGISLFTAKGYLVKQFFIVLALCFLLSILLKRLLQFFGLDRIKYLRFKSYLHYLLSGRDKRLKETRRAHFIALLRKKYRVQVDLLCQIGDKMKIYRGIIKKFKVRDDCLEYLVLVETKR
jgi:hypothetical protein